MGLTFRAGVGALILDGHRHALIFERRSEPEAWQLPQGGLESNESPEQALWRELAEETGLGPAELDLVAEVPEWLGYELPAEVRSEKTGRGQVHKWFILRCRTADPPVRLDRTDSEFRAWRWVDLESLTADVVAFRRMVYRRLVAFVDQGI